MQRLMTGNQVCELLAMPATTPQAIRSAMSRLRKQAKSGSGRMQPRTCK